MLVSAGLIVFDTSVLSCLSATLVLVYTGLHNRAKIGVSIFNFILQKVLDEMADVTNLWRKRFHSVPVKNIFYLCHRLMLAQLCLETPDFPYISMWVIFLTCT